MNESTKARNDSKNKKSKLRMSWFKAKASLIPTKKSTYNITNDMNNNTALKPSLVLKPVSSLRKLHAKLQKPKLKQSKSADETKKLQLQDPAFKLKKLRDNQKDKCFTEMSKECHPSSLWLQINGNNCDSAAMAFQASSKCTDNDACGPCKRISFMLQHCDLTMILTDDAVSNFMSELAGYSHIGLSKDFRHLQIYHSKKQNSKNKKGNKKENVDYSNTKSLLKHIYDSLSKYDMNMNLKKKQEQEQEQVLHQVPPPQNKEKPKESNILNAVSELMMELNSKKDFNNRYMKLGLLSKGANGKIYAVKSWKKHEFYAMKEICFKNLTPSIMYEILRNWMMVQKLELLGTETEIYLDAHRSTFLIVLHLFKGSMCELLKETYMKKRRCLNEDELKTILKNGIIDTLAKMHCNGYIHGDIKPENLVYEYKDPQSAQEMVTAIVDYDLCAKFEANSTDPSVLSEWRGTLGYSAPEWSPYRRQKSQISPKVDIYSLGLTMLILLCGEQPFLCPDAVKKKLEKEDPTINIKQFVYETMINNGEFMISHFLKQLAPKISTDLYDLLQSMLIFDPKHRVDINHVINHRWFH